MNASQASRAPTQNARSSASAEVRPYQHKHVKFHAPAILNEVAILQYTEHGEKCFKRARGYQNRPPQCDVLHNTTAEAS